MVHLVFHVSIKREAALLVHHFVVRQRLIESQPLVDFSSMRSILANLVPMVFFAGFGGGEPHLQSQGKAPWGRGWILAM